MIEVREITSKSEWEKFNEVVSPPTFLHSWSWGEFNTLQKTDIIYLGEFDSEKLVGIALILKVKARRGSFLFCPHGPIFSDAKTKKQYLQAHLEFLKKLAKQEGFSFIRFSPIDLKSEENIKLYKNAGFRDAPTHMHSELVWILNVTPTEEELMAAMRKTTRYSIKKAEKDGVTVEVSSNSQDTARFYEVYKETFTRQHFVPFSETYVKNEFESFAKENKALYLFGRYQNEDISAAMIIYSNGSGFYHHGASTQKFRNIPAAYLVQWEAIKEAKRRGCKSYNFWGIAPENAPNHPWAGLTLFKKGFGGYEEEYVHAQDLVLNNKYWLTYAIEAIRKRKRHL